MTKYLNAKALTKVGDYSASMYELLRVMAVVHLALSVGSFILFAVTRSGEWMISGFSFSVLPVLTLIAFVVGNLLYKEHSVGKMKFTPEYYAAIKDELRSRNITNAKQFLIDNPDHLTYSHELGQHLIKQRYDGIVKSAQIRAFQSLIFSTDMKPQKALEAIMPIIIDRKVTDANEAKAILREFSTAEVPLMSGAL